MSLPYPASPFTTAVTWGHADYVFTFPFIDNNAQVITRTYRIDQTAYNPGALDVVDSQFASYYQVGFGPVSWVDGALLQYTKLFANLPATHDDYESYQYTFVEINHVSVTAYYRPNVTRVVSSKIVYEFYHTTDPEGDIAITQAFQPYLTNVNNYVSYVNFFTTPSDATYTSSIVGTYIAAEDTTFKRLYGNFWQATTRYVIAI